MELLDVGGIRCHFRRSHLLGGSFLLVALAT